MAKAEPRRLTIEVTQEDIDKAVVTRGEYYDWIAGKTSKRVQFPRCVVEVACDRQYPNSGAVAGDRRLTLWQNPTGEDLPQRHTYRGNGREYIEYVGNFDLGNPIEPTTLHLEEE